MIKILIVFGTRPEAIKMAPLVKEFKRNCKKFQTKVCVTSQHREMLDQVLEFYEITPDYDLDLMKTNQNLNELTSKIINGLKPIFDDFKPKYLFVHGDTTTSMAASISGFYANTTICHVEAGLRTNNKFSPFPEEINRRITGVISDIHFSPTNESKNNLLKENVNINRIVVTGNTVIDSLLNTLNKVNNSISNKSKKLKRLMGSKDVILITGHRRENHGKKFDEICLAILEIANTLKDILIIYPVHLNPNVQEPVNRILSKTKNIKLIDPLGYQDFIWLMDKSKLIITDSGGVQEEAPSLGKPVLVMRDTTERPEAVDAGTVILVGSNRELIVKETIDLMNNKIRYDKMSKLHNPYGDGNASKRIVKHIIELENEKF